MATTVSELTNDALALDALRRDVFKGNSKRDLNAMLYLEKMKQRAKDRLQLYDYYLRKAYEYRLLKSYEGEEFNLVAMYDRFESEGLDIDSVVDATAYEKLGAVFRDRISEMTKRIVNEYTYSHPEKSSKRTYRIPKEMLDDFNANGSVTLNMYEMGFFNPNEENIRIVDFGVKYIKAHVKGELGYWGELNLEMTHSGISKFRKDGNIYWFNHMLPKTKNPHFWDTKIDIYDLPEVTDPETSRNSIAISSLLSSILDNKLENIMLFSRPSVWSDITMTKQVTTDNDCEIMIDSLVLMLQYDYTRRTEDLCNIDISTSNGLMPYIACSEEDVSKHCDGKGCLFRSYRKSYSSVTFTAQDKYETYYFKNWTDRSGKVVSETTDLTVNRQKDQYYIANYERRVPILNVPDTIKVSHGSGEYTIPIGNVGSGDVEMDWYVSDSLSTWIHLQGQTEGVDEGSFSFKADANKSGISRVDSLEIFAPETDEMVKMLYIVQVDDNDPAVHVEQVEAKANGLHVYPNPMREYVKVEGKDLLSVSLYSMTGREVCQRSADGGSSVVMDVRSLPAGAYILSVRTASGSINRKVLKVE